MASKGSPLLGEVARAFPLTFVNRQWVEPVLFPVPAPLVADLNWVLENYGYSASEAGVCENLINPVLKEVAKAFPDFIVWSHVPICADEELTGVPDYIVCRRGRLGLVAPEQPFLLVVEAKRDDYERAWGQCLAAMLATRKLNGREEMSLHGITTNGRGWEFGKLSGKTLIRETRQFSLADLEQLLAVINFVFLECRKELLAHPFPEI